MFRAQHEQVVQNANISLVNIRQIELDYFNKFFSSFGTQCFLLAGFISGALSQTPALYDNSPYIFHIIYDVSTAVCFTLCMQGLIVAVFVTVFGQGLALRGPPGSMVNAIQGMVVEQRSVLILFALAVFSYVIQECGMFYIMMDIPCATACSVIVLVSGAFTYSYATRIYNRFSFDEKVTTFCDETEPEVGALPSNSPSLRGLDPSLPVVTALFDTLGERRARALYDAAIYNAKLHGDELPAKKVKVVLRIAQKEEKAERKSLKKLQKLAASEESESSDSDKSVGTTRSGVTAVSSRSVVSTHSTKTKATVGVHESGVSEATETITGAITVRVKKRFTDPWERRFAVIKNNELFFYTNKRAYELKPGKPINGRPIDLEGYGLVAGSHKPPFSLSLVPIDEDDIRKPWIFRCDTAGEMETWLANFSSVLRDIHGDSQEFINTLEGDADDVENVSWYT